MNDRIATLKSRFEKRFAHIYFSDEFSCSKEVWEFIEDAIREENKVMLREQRDLRKRIASIRKLAM